MRSFLLPLPEYDPGPRVAKADKRTVAPSDAEVSTEVFSVLSILQSCESYGDVAWKLFVTREELWQSCE
jgi:hypothetical protein